MRDLFVDLHVHSFYSDGSMSPNEIVESACKNGVGVLAIADHDIIDGNIEICKMCEKNGIWYIPAVEIDSLDNKTNFHILAYGFDIGNKKFLDFLSHTRFLLDEASVKLIEVMQSDYYNLSLSDYMDFTYNIRLGGWKALHYFMEKGLTSSLKEGIKFYPQYNISHDKYGFSSISSIAYRIRKAGGYSVLAHPGETIDSEDIEKFRTELSRIMAYGVDGIECYYPSHSDPVTKTCLDFCRKNGLLITTGSDCHGLFGKTKVGEMNIPLHSVVLKDLADRRI